MAFLQCHAIINLHDTSWKIFLFFSAAVCPESNLRLVKSMPIVIRRAFPAIVACPFMKTPFTSTDAANRTLMALIYIIELNLSHGHTVCLFEDISCYLFVQIEMFKQLLIFFFNV